MASGHLTAVDLHVNVKILSGSGRDGLNELKKILTSFSQTMIVNYKGLIITVYMCSVNNVSLCRSKGPQSSVCGFLRMYRPKQSCVVHRYLSDK